MRWTAIVNPAAGRGRTRRRIPEMRNALSALDVEVVVSPDPEAPARIGRDAAGRGDGLVACGGDGTVSALAGVAAEAGVPFAVVPTGAGNDFARALGLDPKHPLAALDCIRDGSERAVDLGRVTSGGGTTPSWFTTVANTGFDAEANRWANTVRRLSGTTLYAAAIARTVLTYRPQRFRVGVDGADPVDHEAWLVAVANTSTYAGGMKIAAPACIDDGLLDVTIIGAVHRAVLVANLGRVASGTIANHPAATTLTGRSFTLASPDDVAGPPLDLWAAGERIGPLPRTIEVVPGALRAMVPTSS